MMEKVSYEVLFLFLTLIQFVSRQVNEEERLNLSTFGKKIKLGEKESHFAMN